MTVALALAGLVVAVGALVQGAVGYGMALVAAPLLVLIDPALVPVPLLLLAFGHSLLALGRENRRADWRGVGWAMLGRLPGSVVGALAVTRLPQRGFLLVVGLSVLVCAVLSVVSWRPRPTARALVVAGFASGATGTAASIGGPPIALLYQHESGPTVRATLGAYFVLGSVLSLVALAGAGAVTADALLVALWLLPFVVVGFLLSNPARRRVDGRWFRVAVLTVAVASALLLVGRAL